MSGITDAGFVRKTRAEVLASMQAEARVQFGADVDLGPFSDIGLMQGIEADEVDELWQLAENIWFNNFLNTGEGVGLDEVVALGGIARNPATRATVELELFGTATTVVDVGFQAQTLAGVAFITTEAGTISTQSGFQEIDSTPVVFSGSTVPAITAATYDLDVTVDGGGLNQLSFAIAVTDNWDAIVAEIQVQLRAATGSTETVTIVNGNIRITSATASDSSAILIAAGTAGSGGGDLLAFIVASVANMTATILTAVAGSNGRADIAASAVLFGTVGVVGAATITQITTGVAGVVTVNNRAESTGGAAIETDAALRARYKARGTSGGSSAVAIQSALNNLASVVTAKVFENVTLLTDGAGLPAKSLEAVIDGGTNDDIMGVLLPFKPAGIETFGTVTGTKTDNQGNLRTFKWSVPTPVDIYVDVDITSNADWDSSFEATVKARVAAIVGGTSAGVTYPGGGIDADVFAWQVIANFDDILGIDVVTVKVAKTPSPTLDLVAIDRDERARTDDAKIVITVT